MFRAGAVDIDSVRLPLQLLLPPRPQRGLQPLLVFLHGAGERGSDNQRQLTWLPPALTAAPTPHPCFALAVQCPAGMQWVEVPWDRQDSQPMPASPSLPLRAVISAVQQLLSQEPIDRDRVYLTGLSMGGYGCWDLASRHPDWFAAVLPVCGGGDVAAAPRLRELPIWAWHGGRDEAVPVQQSRAMVSALRAIGGAVRYSELALVGHDSWHQAYGPNGGLDWLFAQRRS